MNVLRLRYFFCMIFLIHFSTQLAGSIFISVYRFKGPVKPHEQWWEMNLENRMNEFAQWLGGENADSRVKMRQYVKQRGYKTFLDIPCGLCTEYFGYKKDNIEIDYYGVDITQKLVERGCGLGLNVIRGSIEEIPCYDLSIDVCYARHILEHLDYYKKAITELIRVAAKEVIVIFFIKPNDEPDKINSSMDSGALLYHNRYNKQKLSLYVMFHEKVENIQWEDINGQEVALHIYLKNQ